MKRKTLLILITAFLLSTEMNAQTDGKLTYSVESGITTANGDHSPLWLNANKQGISSISKDNGYLTAGVFRSLEKEKIFSYGYGLELAGAYNFTSKFIIQQAYLDLKYRKIGLSIGSKERNGEFVNQQLSSGGLTLSGNARPVPQVWAGLPDYVTVPGTRKWLSFRGHVAYGWFTDGSWQENFAGATGKYVKGMLFHSKALYLKLEKEDVLPLRFEMGLEMEDQFGGTQHNNGNIIKMPSGIKDYLKALVPMSGGNDTPGGEQLNIEGNMLGSWHFSLNYHLHDWNLRAYYEHHYNDHSMLVMEYPWKDGMYGLEITPPANPFVSGVVYEYIYSKDQSGPVYWDHTKVLPEQISARDNYYNHYFYTGWQHWGMAMGNPLFMSPIYNKDGSLSFKSNRITAHHLGISGCPTQELKYRVLLSHSDNWGTYDKPFKEIMKNTSSLVELTYSPRKLTGWSFTASAATDRGDMLGDNTGGMITIRKTGLLSK
ncbi:capsule assembly Wzi family protein [uncultured Bacteroides sp.]|uniref:capsule assembly Wzi family protein n=1 Tax=uncultured Bacteroides sp. TaxID=162156 RepID=UPI002AAAD0BF|nr:capsule assembly Wzi family protein [uncultured Bacteroides sp.]